MKERKIPKKFKKVIFYSVFTILLLVCAILQGGADDTININTQGNREEAIKRMRLGFEAYEDSIDISDLSIYPDELGLLFSHATKDTPYLFFVSSKLSYTYHSGGCVIAVKPNYCMGREEAERAVEYCRREIHKIASIVSCHRLEVDRLVATHDLLCRDFSYDLTLESDDIYSFLTRKRVRVRATHGLIWRCCVSWE